LGIDRDPQAIAVASARLAFAADRFTALLGNYGDAASLLASRQLGPVDGWLVDAGVSSHQLDDPSRGFSFREDGPLDMRMGEDAPTLAEWLDAVDHPALARVLGQWGELPQPTRVATAILRARSAGKLTTTGQLRDAIVSATPAMHRTSHINPATLAFQALRIAVNGELEHLERAVASIPQVVKPGGRAAFISFHSLEDRIVKQGVRALEDPCTCPAGLPVCACGAYARVRVLTSRPIQPSDAEVRDNPRARSAKLRVVEVCAPPSM
jgi:16S rRNA (cytosine1402-N4)-methyltransferase